MRLAGMRLMSLAVAALLVLSAVQMIPVASAITVSHDTPSLKPIPGFTVKGSAPDGLPVTVSIAIPLRNLGLLSSLVKQVSDPTSPNYRHFLSDQQAAELFYPTQQFEEMMQYLSTTGLQVQSTALDSMIVLQGSAAQVRQAFGTDLRVYSNGTDSYYISTTDSFRGAYFSASNMSAVALRPAVDAPSRSGANVTFTEGGLSAKLLQRVYNATGLYSKGFNGTGKTIGILDFYGSPTVTSDLQSFDKRFGLPNPTFNIIPIGPYAPNLGAFTGWDVEIALDVQSSHTMAPGATVDLYIGNAAISIADAISKIVQDNKVNTLSQSFTYPEWYYSFAGPAFYVFNALMPDQYYMLGSLKGITFSGATGDFGGSGETTGLLGDLGYPASSPYVTAAGGTQTYFAGSSFVQTAWTGLGYATSGSGTGGVSDLEPQPWYQASQPVPATLPLGRLNPDVSLQSATDPATFIVNSGQLILVGGTSEASPLFAGLVTLLDSSIGGSVGMINPFLYSLGNNPATYTKAFTPITFGFNTPWAASSGFNLATGWGAPNIGEIYGLYNRAQSQPSLNVTVALSKGVDSSGLEFTPGSKLGVTAIIKQGAATVTTGSFTAELVTLTGNTPIKLSYDAASSNWTGSLTMGSQAGMAFVNVQGSSGGVSGSGFATLFAGYLGTFLYPVATDPWSTVGGLTVTTTSTDLDGNSAPAGPQGLIVTSYSILTNTYSTSYAVIMPSAYNLFTGSYNNVILNASIPAGPSALVLTGGTYGYLPFISGIYLQNTYVYPPVAAEPGSVAPGQELTIIAAPIAPINLYFVSSLETGSIFGSDVAVGSNVTAQLVSPTGKVVSTAALAYQSCAEALKVCGGGAPVLNGYLPVPAGSTPGLYTVVLTAAYGSDTIGKTINGSYYGQVWVSGGSITPSVSIEPGSISATAASESPVGPVTLPSNFYEGEQSHVVVKLDYPNGTAVRYGEYTAVVYPQTLASQYTTLMHTVYEGCVTNVSSCKLVQLTFDPSLQEWLGNVTLPSPADSGNLAPLVPSSFAYSGPYDIYVTGISVDGAPTTTAIAAQQPFFIQPYVLVSGGTVGSLTQNSQLAFSGATITASGTLSGDLFLGANTVNGGTLTISDSQIQGSLTIQGGNVTLSGVSGGGVTLTSGTLTLKDSSVGALALNGGKVSISDSSYTSLSPPLPYIAVSGLSSTVSGAANYSIAATGEGLGSNSLSAWIDGNQVTLQQNSTSTGAEAIGSVNAMALNDGVHTLVVTATQSDGLSSTLTTTFNTNAKETALAGQLNTVSGQLNTVAGQLQQADANINSLSSQLQQSTSTLFDLSYAVIALGLVALVVALLAFRKKPASAPAPA